MFTMTALDELIVASGKPKGLALIGMPPMLVTLREPGADAGRAKENGEEVETTGVALPPSPFRKVLVSASSLIRPGLGPGTLKFW